jgi:hypothetical protein
MPPPNRPEGRLQAMAYYLLMFGEYPKELVAGAGKRLTSISRQLQNGYSVCA